MLVISIFFFKLCCGSRLTLCFYVSTGQRSPRLTILPIVKLPLLWNFQNKREPIPSLRCFESIPFTSQPLETKIIFLKVTIHICSESFLLRLQLEHFSLPLVPTLQDRIAHHKKTIIKKRSPTWSQTGTGPKPSLPRHPNRGGGSRLSAGGTPSAPPPLASTSPRWRTAGAHFRFRCESPGRGGARWRWQ